MRPSRGERWTAAERASCQQYRRRHSACDYLVAREALLCKEDEPVLKHVVKHMRRESVCAWCLIACYPPRVTPRVVHSFFRQHGGLLRDLRGAYAVHSIRPLRSQGGVFQMRYEAAFCSEGQTLCDLPTATSSCLCHEVSRRLHSSIACQRL